MPLFPLSSTGTLTACIKGFFEVEKGIENAIKSMNLIILFKVQNLLVKFVLFMAFSIPFPTLKNPFMQAVTDPTISDFRDNSRRKTCTDPKCVVFIGENPSALCSHVYSSLTTLNYSYG